MSDESTPLFDWPGPPGTWLDLADAHFLTTASLRAALGVYASITQAGVIAEGDPVRAE